MAKIGKFLPKSGTREFGIVIAKMTPEEIRKIAPDIQHNEALIRKRDRPWGTYVGDLEDREIVVPERLREAEIENPEERTK